MNTTRRARQMVGIGLLTMVTGALLPLASAGANPSGDRGPKIKDEDKVEVTICHATNSVKNPYTEITVSYNSVDGTFTNGNGNGGDHGQHTGPVFDPTKTYPKPIADDAWGDIVPPFDDYPGSDNWFEGGAEIHAAGCEVPSATTLTVKKIVDGDAPPAEWTIPFSGLEDGFELTEEFPESDAFAITAGEEYEITEDDDLDADATSIECDDAATVEVDDLTVTVTVDEGDHAVCTFTNTYDADDPEPATLTVEKKVVGPAPAETFSFSLTDGDEFDEEFDLAHGESSDPIELVAGEYELEETETRGAENVSVSCTNDATGDESVDLTLAEGEDVTCTFTNTFTPAPAGPAPVVVDDDPARLTVVKEVQGDEDGWSFDFDGTLGAFELTSDDPQHSESDLDPGEYTVNEAAGTPNDGFTVASVRCDDEAETVGTIATDQETASVTVTLAAGDDVTCIFVSRFIEVGETIAPQVPQPNTPQPNRPQPQERPVVLPSETVRAQPQEAVLGATTVRTLPQTGSSSHLMAAAGFALVMLGTALSIAGRMRRTAMR